MPATAPLKVRVSVLTVVVGVGLAACSSATPSDRTELAAALPAQQQMTDAVSSVQLAPVADTFVSQHKATRNYGSAKSMPLAGRRSSGLMRFEVPVTKGSAVTDAKLLLTVKTPKAQKSTKGSKASPPVAIYATSGGWKESKVSWKTAPKGAARLAQVPTTGAGGNGAKGTRQVMVDVGSAVPAAGGAVNLRVEAPTADGVTVASREAGSTEAPMLMVTTQSTVAAVPTATPSPAAGVPVWKAPPAPAATTPAAAAGGGSGSGSSSGGSDGSTAPGGGDGWSLNWKDDFNGTGLAGGWGAYNGDIGAMPGGHWNPNQIEVGGGLLRLHSSQKNGGWSSGGAMNNTSAQQTYGKYLVRFRMDKAPGVKYAIILWPASENWPNDGEIDFGEDGGGDRSGTTATVHWGTQQNHEQEQRSVSADFSQWHTLGVEWTPGKLVYTLDGKPYGTVTGGQVPTTPHNLVVQTEAGGCSQWMTCVNASTPADTVMEVDWVAAYKQS